MKLSKHYTALILLLILTVMLRIPFSQHEQGVDSFRTHYMANYILKDQFISWNTNLLSFFGLFPYSYASGIALLLAILTKITGLNSEICILILSIIIGVFGTLLVYVLSFHISKNDKISLLSAFFF